MHMLMRDVFYGNVCDSEEMLNVHIDYFLFSLGCYACNCLSVEPQTSSAGCKAKKIQHQQRRRWWWRWRRWQWRKTAQRKAVSCDVCWECPLTIYLGFFLPSTQPHITAQNQIHTSIMFELMKVKNERQYRKKSCIFNVFMFRYNIYYKFHMYYIITKCNTRLC